MTTEEEHGEANQSARGRVPPVPPLKPRLCSHQKQGSHLLRCRGGQVSHTAHPLDLGVRELHCVRLSQALGVAHVVVDNQAQLIDLAGEAYSFLLLYSAMAAIGRGAMAAKWVGLCAWFISFPFLFSSVRM